MTTHTDSQTNLSLQANYNSMNSLCLHFNSHFSRLNQG